MSARIGFCINPMSGRDVRRLAGRASNMTHEAKRDMVARLAAGADALGVDEILIVREPFSIAEKALQHMKLKAKVRVLDLPVTNSAKDSENAVNAFIDLGCRTIVSLGGDGTNRAIVRSQPNINLLPISTGTNNVFPMMVEPTLVGMVASLIANESLDELTSHALSRKVKVIRVTGQNFNDLALVDAVLLRDDHVGNLLPFAAEKIMQLVLARAEPDGIGMSPIGGYLDPVFCEDDFALSIKLGREGRSLKVPLSPGLFGDVTVEGTTRLELNQSLDFLGPGVIALDGDRDHRLSSGEHAQIKVCRDGPRVFDVAAVMRAAVQAGLLVGRARDMRTLAFQ